MHVSSSVAKSAWICFAFGTYHQRNNTPNVFRLLQNGHKARTFGFACIRRETVLELNKKDII